MKTSPLAGKPPPASLLIDVSKLIEAYYQRQPDPYVPSHRVEFGTSGHRGTSLKDSFNENHILAITQAICLYRSEHKITGPLMMGMDTHALSKPALETALQVLAANGVTVFLSKNDEHTPTPAISRAIISHNQQNSQEMADGIIITPSHNPPDEGGFKYNPPHGGPAEPAVTSWIEDKANFFLEQQLEGVKRVPLSYALAASTTHYYDYCAAYVSDLEQVIDMQAIRESQIHIGVDPLGGAGTHYWKRIAKTYDLNLTVVNETLDPTFAFMSVDWDGKIRMDPSSAYAMQGLIELKEQFDIAFACDTDYDRHGIVTKSRGLLPPNHYLSAAIFYLFQHRPQWSKKAAVGKTLVSSRMIDYVAAKLERKLYEVPVGFKWFVEGLLDGSLGFGGEESAGATFIRLDGSPWTTDKDGIILSLLAAEITAKLGKDPGEVYADLVQEFGEPLYDRVEAPATPAQKKRLKQLSRQSVESKELAGEEILAILTEAPGNNASIGGVKVITSKGWFAARPSGTEDIYKIYAESFLSKEHLAQIVQEAQLIVNTALKT